MDEARYLPPGQIETRRFPIVGEREPAPDFDPSEWRLEVVGEVADPVTYRLDELIQAASSELVFDIHCVTGWTRFDSRWTGLPLAELLGRAKPGPDARFVSFETYSSRAHHTSLPLELAMQRCWIVHAFEGRPLPAEHGGPVRVVTPGRYFYKSPKWVRRVVLLREDRKGWWETHSSYHNNADPASGEERFTTGSIRPDQLRRFLEATSYDKYRGKVLLGLDLRSWSPADRNLRRLYLKNCVLTGVDLSGVDLRNSNLSLSDLSGADLRRADLSGSDLEGADFSGADLTGANLADTALSATRFYGPGGEATLTGANFDGSWGLVEQQEAYVDRRR
ncbi:MAG: molybdopterin-dependent oxidoreductase [Acidimicrobiia bacterium]